YEWDFGDGSGSSLTSPSHTYTGNTGDHTVVLTASNPCTYSVTSQILTVHNYAVAIAPTTVSASGDPGTVVSYTLQVTNTGTLPDVVELILGSHTWTTVLSDDSLTLAAGASESVEVWVTVPASASGDDHDSVQVTARSTNDPRMPVAAASATLNTGANGVYGVTLGPATASQQAYPGQIVMYTLQVTNTGNTLDTITFTRTVPGWDTSFSVPSLVIAAGGRRTIQVYVTIPAEATDGQMDVAVIRATGSGNYADVTLTTTAMWRKLYLPLTLRNYTAGTR
ncbi:MAG: PKD domain-containing protein, partial [Chloroflexi bacterium]|nr:PKD domain-containing protein [Chloroflexota bacterium]